MPGVNDSLGEAHNLFYSRAVWIFFLIHENFTADVIATDIGPGYRTDHSAVTITFRFTERARGRTFRKFNSSLLKHKEYVRKIKESIKETKLKYTKNVDTLGIVHDDNTGFQIDDQLLSEVMSMNIWNVAISYATLTTTTTNKTNKRTKEGGISN